MDKKERLEKRKETEDVPKPSEGEKPLLPPFDPKLVQRVRRKTDHDSKGGKAPKPHPDR